MAIEFVCTNCGKTLRVPDEHLGKKARCPACQSINLIQPAGSATVDFEPKANEFNQSQPDVQKARDQIAQPTFNPYAAASTIPPSNRLEPHRGGLVLTLGLISFFCGFCFVPGTLAWVFGQADLKKMKAGSMDREGHTITMIGMILGIVSVAFQLLVFFLYFVVFLLAMAN